MLVIIKERRINWLFDYQTFLFIAEFVHIIVEFELMDDDQCFIIHI